jgi:hypothetical protein
MFISANALREQEYCSNRYAIPGLAWCLYIGMEGKDFESGGAFEQKSKPHHGWTLITRIYKFKMVLIELLDPCNSVLSVLSVVRFLGFCAKGPGTQQGLSIGDS